VADIESAQTRLSDEARRAQTRAARGIHLSKGEASHALNDTQALDKSALEPSQRPVAKPYGRPVLTLALREWRLSIRDGAALGTAVGFYGLVIVVLPFGIGPDRGLLQSVAPGMIWIATVLAALLSVDRLFAADHRAGLLDVISMGDVPLEVVVTVKTLVHWATTVVPLVLAAPVAGLMLGLPLGQMPAIVLALAVGTPCISAIGSIGAALTLGGGRSSLLLSLIVLPLFVPTLIFGALAGGSGMGDGDQTALIIVGALSALAMVMGPLASAAALRTHIAS